MNIDFKLVSYALNEKLSSIGIHIFQLVSIDLFISIGKFKFVSKYFLSIGIKKELVIKIIYISFILVSKFWLVSLRFVFNASFTFNWHFLKFLLMCSLSIGIMLILLGPLCWWLTKRGRSIWVYMHVFMLCMFLYWYQVLVSIVFVLCFVDIGIKSDDY